MVTFIYIFFFLGGLGQIRNMLAFFLVFFFVCFLGVFFFRGVVRI